MKRFTSAIFLILFLFSPQLNAQRSKAYLALGSNLTQDYLTGSGNSQVGTRLGLNIGTGVSTLIYKKWETSIELLYSQNGYYSKIVQTPAIALNKIKLHFIEVPMTLAYRFNIKQNEKKHFHKFNLSSGIAYARLFKHKIIAIDGTNVTNEVQFDQENALLFNFAGTSYFNESIALNGRVTLSTFGEWTMALRLLFYI